MAAAVPRSYSVVAWPATVITQAQCQSAARSRHGHGASLMPGKNEQVAKLRNLVDFCVISGPPLRNRVIFRISAQLNCVIQLRNELHNEMRNAA